MDSPLTFRVATPDDAAAMLAIYAPYITENAVSFELEVPTVEEFQDRIRKTLETHPWIVGLKDGQIVGYAYGCEHRARKAYQWSVDVTIYIVPSFQGKGLGKAIYRRLFGILKHQGFCTAGAGITLPNPASVGLHESVGFSQVALYSKIGFKFGQWRDVGWWQMGLQEHALQPAIPIEFASLPSDEVRSFLA